MVCASQYYDRTLGWSGRREPVAIRVLPPVETAGLTVADIPQLMAQCRQQMEAAIADLEPYRLNVSHETACLPAEVLEAPGKTGQSFGDCFAARRCMQ